PTTGLINIALNQNQKYIEVEVKAMNGVAIVAKSYEYPGNTILDLSPYPKGIYLLTVKTLEQVFTEKIILQ
ncbi:MAG: T9SS type A sorting domain-containing protein, partial [Clostridia bacterium]|nr:T9SS type A sorting domain-containing protein [Clostridia bacterium]